MCFVCSLNAVALACQAIFAKAVKRLNEPRGECVYLSGLESFILTLFCPLQIVHSNSSIYTLFQCFFCSYLLLYFGIVTAHGSPSKQDTIRRCDIGITGNKAHQVF